MRTLPLYIAIILFALAFSLPRSYASDEPETVARPEAGKLAKWAWEISDVTEGYPATNNSYWEPVSSPLGGGLRFLHFRDRADRDEFLFSGYFFFRPLVLDFSESYLALGAYLTFDYSWQEGSDPYDMFNPKVLYEMQASSLAMGFSAKFSMPQNGVQMTLEIGHLWNRLESEAKDLTFVTAPATTTGKFLFNQKDTGLDIFYNFTVASERTYLSALSLNAISYYRTGPREVSAREVHPPSVEINVPKVQNDFVVGLLYIKLLGVSADVMGDSPLVKMLGISELLTIESAGAIGHFAQDDGHVWSAGCRVSLMDNIAFSYFHTWEQQNDADNADIFFFEIGLLSGDRLATGR